MRRTLGLAAVVGMVIVLGGVASATPLTPVPEPASPAAGPPAAPAVVPEQVGTEEPVEAALTYLDRERSLTLHYPGAEYVKVHLARVDLRAGDHVTVSDPTGQESHRYAPEPVTGTAEAGQWAMSVTGDTAVVTLHTLADPGGSPPLGVRVDRVARGFAPGEAPESAVEGPGPSGREESICGRTDSRDAACFRARHPAAYRSAAAVARLLIDGTQLCTAFRVGPANRLLTNNHCLDSTREARRTEVWFGYQCVECGSRAVFRPTKVRADEVLATDEVLDFTLFTVEDLDRVERYGYLELETGQPEAGERIYIPQHPGGAPTRIAMRSDSDRGGACTVGRSGVHGYGWYTDVSYYCDTEAGSSGSPVLSRETHRVIALHHLGGCPNTGVRMDLIHPKIAPHLPR